MPSYESLLRSLMPDFFWFRDGHSIDGGRIKVWGSVLLGEGIQHDQITTYIDGKPVDWNGPTRSLYAEKTFWFVRDAQKFGIDFSAPLGENTSSIIATTCLEGLEPERRTEFSFNQYTNWQDLLPTPPIENIERVSGKGATAYNYHNNGSSDFVRFCSISARHGLQIAPSTRVLDWGCGCGRLTRYFLSARVNVHGIDIDPQNIQWCQDNMDASAFGTTGLFPPTRFTNNSFDLVIANSVLSHLNLDAMEAWLAELGRILRPGGLALLSYHGQFSLCGFSSRTESFVRDVLETGFNAKIKAVEVNDVIADPEYYRHTFMTDEFAASIFKKYFDIEEQVTGVVSRFQNMAVLKNR